MLLCRDCKPTTGAFPALESRFCSRHTLTVGWRFGIHVKRFRVAFETDLAYDTEHWKSVATATALNVGHSF